MNQLYKPTRTIQYVPKSIGGNFLSFNQMKLEKYCSFLVLEIPPSTISPQSLAAQSRHLYSSIMHFHTERFPISSTIALQHTIHINSSSFYHPVGAAKKRTEELQDPILFLRLRTNSVRGKLHYKSNNFTWENMLLISSWALPLQPCQTRTMIDDLQYAQIITK